MLHFWFTKLKQKACSWHKEIHNYQNLGIKETHSMITSFSSFVGGYSINAEWIYIQNTKLKCLQGQTGGETVQEKPNKKMAHLRELKFSSNP